MAAVTRNACSAHTSRGRPAIALYISTAPSRTTTLALDHRARNCLKVSAARNEASAQATGQGIPCCRASHNKARPRFLSQSIWPLRPSSRNSSIDFPGRRSKNLLLYSPSSAAEAAQGCGSPAAAAC